MFKTLLVGAVAFLGACSLVAAEPGRAYLGLLGENPAADSNQTGALVREVVKDGPADKAGVKPGDRIVQLEDQEIKSFDDLQVRMGAYRSGQSVKLVVVRDGKEETLTVELGERAAEPSKPDGKRLEPGPGGFRFQIPFEGALPEEIQKQLEEALRNAKPLGAAMAPRPMVGVQLQPIDEDLANKLGLGDTKGVLVAAVTPDGPAAKAGIEADDVILEVDGKAVAAPEDVKSVVADKKEGDKLTFKIRRGEETLDKTVEVAVGPMGLPPGVFFREFRSEPRAGDAFGDIRERIQEMEKRFEQMTKDRMGDLQKKLESLKSDSEKRIEDAQKRIEKLERRLEEMARRFEEGSAETPKDETPKE